MLSMNITALLEKGKTFVAGKIRKAPEQAPRLAANVVGALKKLLSRNEAEQEAEFKPKGQTYIHYNETRDTRPKAVFHVFGPEGLIAHGDNYGDLVAAVEAGGLSIDSPDLLTTKTEKSGTTLFFGYGAIWVDMAGLGLACLRNSCRTPGTKRK